MTQEHLRNLIERAVEKANADNTDQDFIRTRVNFEPTGHENLIRADVRVYDQSHQLILAKGVNDRTNTTEYKFVSDIDGFTHNIPAYPDESITDEELQDRLVDTLYVLFKSEQLEMTDVPETLKQQMIIDGAEDLWDNIKNDIGNVAWEMKPYISQNPNEVIFDMNLEGVTSKMTIASYDAFEGGIGGCVVIKTENQPVEFYPEREGSLIDDAVYDMMMREVQILNEGLVSDIPNNHRRHQRLPTCAYRAKNAQPKCGRYRYRCLRCVPITTHPRSDYRVGRNARIFCK